MPGASEPRPGRVPEVGRAAGAPTGRSVGDVDRVVVGIDGSGASRAALRFGALLAAGLGAKLRVASSWELPVTTALPTGPRVVEGRREADAATRSLLDQVIADEVADDRTDPQPVVLRGPASAGLLDVASEPPGAVVVVGARGLGGVAGIVVGSTSQALLRDGRVPVVVVGPGLATVPERIGCVAIAVDGSAGSLAAAAWGGRLAARLGARVVAVHGIGVEAAALAVITVPNRRQRSEAALADRWTQPIREAGAPCTTRLVEDDAGLAILEVAAECGADLIVLGRGEGHRLRIGHVTDAVVRHAQVPVAVVGPPSEGAGS